MTDTAEGFRIEASTRKNWFIIAFMGFWLVGWAVGEFTVVGLLLSGGLATGSTGGTAVAGTFLVVWLGGWTVGGGFVLYIWLWQVVGKERVTVTVDGLCVQRRLPLLTRTKEYRQSDIRGLRLSSAGATVWGMSRGLEFWGLSGGALAFDYGARTVRFGIGFDEAEAALARKEILDRAPGLSS